MIWSSKPMVLTEKLGNDFGVASFSLRFNAG